MNCQILCVEDSESDEKLITHALQDKNIFYCRDGQEAIDFILNKTTSFIRLILLDLKLPKKDGIEVLKAIRKNSKLKNCPVVILSGSSEETDIQNSLKAGANSYVQKPQKFKEFCDQIKQIAEYWIEVNKNANCYA